jgi:iron complex transport system substrate-binding protein
MRRLLPLGTLFILFAALLLPLAACGDNEEQPAATAQPAVTAGATPSAEKFPLVVARSDGRQLTIPELPRRIASLSPGATEVLYAVGAGPQVVATDLQSDYPPEAESTTRLDAFQPNVEAIVGVEADLIIIAVDQDNIVEALDNLDKTVLFLEVPDTIDGVMEQVRLLALVSGHESEGERLVQEMDGRIEAVTDKLVDVLEGPRVYHELDNTFFTVAPESFVGDFYKLLEARNIAEGAPSAYPQLTQEEILDRDPEVIVLADADAGESPETVKARPGWGAISAVKNDRIYVVDPDIVSRPGPRVVEGLEELARILYPEKFP